MSRSPSRRRRGGGARFDEGRVASRRRRRARPSADALRVVALGFQHRLGARPDRVRGSPTRLATGRGRTAAVLARFLALAAGRGIRLCRKSSGLRTNGATACGHRRQCFFSPGRRRLNELLALPPAPLGRLARRLAQVLVMQHHALAVEGEHHNRLVSDRLARRRSARRVEGVEVLSRASDQRSATLGHLARYGETARTALRRTTAMRPLRPPRRTSSE